MANWRMVAAAGVSGLTMAAAPAHAESPDLADDVAALRAEVEALRAELRALRASQSPSPAPAAAPAATVPAVAGAAAPPGDPIQVRWKGGPEFSAPGGWTFKPRGRIQVDASYLDAPIARDNGVSDGRGLTTEIRRAYIGFQGTVPGGFGYRVEADIAANSVELTDIYLTWDKGPFNVTIGQHYPFLSFEQQTSDLFTSFTERAAFTGAFNFERRVGLSVGYRKDAVMVNVGAFTDDVSALGSDSDKAFSVDGRVVWMPKFGDTQLHLAASAHLRDLNAFQAAKGTQYRQRPEIHSTDIRYVDTGLFTVDRETNYGLETVVVHRRFHAVGEASWLRARTPIGADPTFFGGYAEVGYYLTRGDTRAYKNGAFDRNVPVHGLDQGGIGAIELNARYDHLDLTDATIVGGEQDSYGLSVVWTPVPNIRFLADYFHLVYDTSLTPAKFNAEAIGLRAQVDF